ncbi:unnamed protein product [Hermetia illucens]|uniref:Uncharacterized protein n=1 Tax=Hermetia illucens TaxID=343691 RepID=A0A7R8YVV8_HERIL|nr:unnamed protein product [Hermetia illucens]
MPGKAHVPQSLILLNLILRIEAPYTYICDFQDVKVSMSPDYGTMKVEVINNIVFIDTNITQAIKNPQFYMSLNEQTGNRITRRIVKISMKTCDVGRLAETNPFINVIAIIVRKHTNLPFVCPLPAGRYFVRNLTVSSDFVPLRLFYKPNSVIVLDGYYTAEKSTGRTTKFNVTMRALSTWSNPSVIIANSTIINNTINVDFHILHEIKDVEFRLTMHELRNEKMTKLMDEQFRPCVIKRLIKISPYASGAMHIISDYTNFGWKCAYKPGLYYLRNYPPGSEIIPLRFVYQHKVVAQCKTTFYMNHFDKIAEILVRYEVTRN